MKKITAVLLAMLMLFSVAVSGLSVFAAVDVSVEFADSNPISIADVESSRFTSVYYLHESEIYYEVTVTMPDGTKQTLNSDPAVKGAGRYSNYGQAYVDFEECEIAALNESATVPVHIHVEVTDNYKGEKHGEYDFVVYKKLVDKYILEIIPVTGIPNFIYEGSEAVNFSIAQFKVVYWNGLPATYMAKKTDEIGEKPEYTLNGAPLKYGINRYENKVFVSYIDSDYVIQMENVKEFPFISIKIIDCTLKGDMPQTIKYELKWRNGTTETYTANVNSYSGYINHVEGYNIGFETKGSRFMSMITLRVGDIEDTESYEIEQAGFFARLIAKLTVFLKKVYSAVFPSKD